MPRRHRSQPAPERTEAEREHDREERARRRAARAGELPDDAPAVAQAPHTSSPVEESGEVPSATDLPSGASPTTETGETLPVASMSGEAAHEAGAPVETPPAAAAPVEILPAVDAPAEISPTIESPQTEPDAAGDLPDPVVDQHVEAPVADVTAEDLPAPLEAPLPPLPPVPQRGSPAAAASIPSPRRRGRRSFRARLGALLALAAVIVAVLLLLGSLGGSGHSKTVALPAVVRVVIPEGETRLQIARIAAADGLAGNYRAVTKRSSLLNPASYGAPRGTHDLEGFLFPATYEVDRGAAVATLAEQQLLAFRQRFGAGEIRRAHALHRTPYEVLTVASMIEREAQTAHDRPLIAAVIYNRLKEGTPLGIDATIYYAVELRLGIATYTHELTEAQLHIDSPYNTRTHTGLPPTPISNPGMASIEAAAHPAHVSYLYYVAGADGCGEQAFSTTYAEFERNVTAYQAAVKKNGGKPPACKK